MNRPPAGEGLYASLRRLLGSVFDIVVVRIELAAVELEEEKLRLFDALLRALLGLLLLGIAMVLLVCLVVLVVAETWRVPVVAGLAALFVAAGLWALLASRQRLRSPGGLFSGSRGELQADRDALRGAAPTTASAPPSTP